MVSNVLFYSGMMLVVYGIAKFIHYSYVRQINYWKLKASKLMLLQATRVPNPSGERDDNHK